MFSDYTSAPRIDDELQNTQVVKGSPFTGSDLIVRQPITTVIAYRYRIIFLTKAAAAAGAAAIQSALDAEGGNKVPARAVGNAKAVLSNEAAGIYEIQVTYSDSNTVVVEIS